MTKEEKCLLAIDKGYTYDPITGKIYGVYGTEIKTKLNNYIDVMLCIETNKRFHLLGHQFAYYWVYRKVVDIIDHINGTKYDNRICNLRSVTSQQNSFNRKKAKGYYYHKGAKMWQSNITISGKQIYLGMYNTEEEARQVYLTAKEKYHLI